MKKNKSELKILTILVICAFLFRFFCIKENSFHFYFDQARDAYISRGIIERQDLKIQGPSASGTDETVYHGVFYYYLIGPLYTFFGGNPLAPTILLILFNSLTIFPIYYLSKNIYNKNVAYIAVVLYVFSQDAINNSSFLFNASLLTFTIPVFFYFLWKVFFKNQNELLIWLMIFLALCNQTAVFSIYLWLVMIVTYFYRAYKENKIVFFNKNNLIKSFFVYFLLVSSMLITQIKLFQAKIFNPLTILQRVHHDINLEEVIKSVFNLYVSKVSAAIFPSLETFSFFLFLLFFGYYILTKQKNNTKQFLLLWFFSPLILFSFAFRNFYHTLFGILPAVYIILSVQLNKLNKNNIGKLLLFLFFVIYITSNIVRLNQIQAQEYDRISVQKGAYLEKQLQLIEHTYQIAKGAHFSISSLTAPHGYNTTWAYLYDWYGNEKYGYKPYWFGASQEGIPAGELLTRIDKPLDLHFTIYEPDPGSLDVHRLSFQEEQDIFAGSPSATLKFGRLILEQR